MSLKIFLDGRLVDKEDAKVSVFDHGFLYGDGIFEGIRYYNGKIFREKQHIDRLWDSAKTVNIKIPMTKQEVVKAINDTVKANNFTDAYIRLIVSRGAGNLGIDPRSCPKPSVVVIAQALSLYPAEFYEKGIKIVTASTIRNPSDSLSPRVKSLNYLNNIMAKIEAHIAGCEEALMLNHKGDVCECTGDNIFIIRNGKLIYYLPGSVKGEVTFFHVMDSGVFVWKLVPGSDAAVFQALKPLCRALRRRKR